ncbi:MAG: CDP-alcohol phosphatidyltransferase family protein [Vicinamibacterales bacterium]
MSAPRSGGVGLANLITAFRLVLALALWGLWTRAPWTSVGVATVGALLDAIDGPLARRRGEVSRFGARFDMEVDAFLIVTLSVLGWQLGKAGPWVLLSGAMRYVFVGASWIWPWLAADLPESYRRKTVCVVQIVTLIVSLAPVVTPPLSDAVASAGLLLLMWSFAVDVAWLGRRR